MMNCILVANDNSNDFKPLSSCNSKKITINEKNKVPDSVTAPEATRSELPATTPQEQDIKVKQAQKQAIKTAAMDSTPDPSIKKPIENLGLNSKQFMSLAPESGRLKAIGLSNYNEGGLACVAQEGPESFIKKYRDQNIDVRSVFAYHAPDNKDGKMIVATFDDANNLPTQITNSNFKYVDTDYKLGDNEKFVVLGAKEKGNTYKYAILEDTGIKGSIRAMSEKKLEFEDVPYHIYKAAESSTYKPQAHGTFYFVHTPQVAVMPKAYMTGPYMPGQKVGSWTDLYYANMNRCVADALPQLSEKEGFAPRQVWLHDRPAFVFSDEVVKRANSTEFPFSKMKIHSTFHNPGRDYQGWTDDFLGFLRIMGNEEDFEKHIKTLPEFEELKFIDKARNGKLTQNQKERVEKLLKPYFTSFIDDMGTANISMTPVANVKKNKSLATAGTVSKNYGREMKTLRDIARGMRDQLASIETIDITNGSTPANLGFDKRGQVGRGGNTLTSKIEEYTPYKQIYKDNKLINYSFGEGEVILNDTQEIVSLKKAEDLHKSYSFSIKDAKQKNKKWLISTIADCVKRDANGNKTTEIDQDALNRVFFNDIQIKPTSKDDTPRSVLGHLSDYKDSDILFMGWGRPDPQKGLDVSMQAAYDFLTDESIPESKRLRCKFLFGAGDKAWDKAHDNYKVIKKVINDIKKYKNGKFAGNVCYVDGLFPNKLIACASYGMFTSRFEPCGITPLETFSTGTPVISVNTGGAPDFVKSAKTEALSVANGLLTESPFMRNAEDFEFTPDELKSLRMSKIEDLKNINNCSDEIKLSYEKMLDRKRAQACAGEVKSIISKAVDYVDEVDPKSKKTIYDILSENASSQLVDWHENSLYNKNLGSAIELYMKAAWGLDPETLKPLKDTPEYKEIVSHLGKYREKIRLLTESVGKTTKDMPVITPPDLIDKAKDAAKNNLDTSKILKSNFISRVLSDKRTYYAAIALTTVVGIAAYALNRDKAEKANIKVSTIGSSKIYF